MEAAVLIPSGSGSMHSPQFHAGDLDTTAFSFLARSRSSGSLILSQPRSVVHFDLKDRRSSSSSSSSSPSSGRSPRLRRTRSDASVVRSLRRSETKMLEEEAKDTRRSTSIGIREELDFSGGGAGKGASVGGGGGSGNEHGRERSEEIGAYYKEMLLSDPGNPLLLRNYGKFLHEVEGDVLGAEECYGRAILASPGDGEVLSLYGNLMWESHRDEERAEVYYQRAVEASPEDSYVLGSYAHFLWDAEEEERDEEVETFSTASSSSPAVPGGVTVKAF